MLGLDRSGMRGFKESLNAEPSEPVRPAALEQRPPGDDGRPRP
jgi:hypothetical protein